MHLSISGISGEIALSQPSFLQLGVAVDPRCYVIDTDHKFQLGPQYIIQGQLRLPLTLAALETAERHRNGGPPKFAITLHASVFVKNKQTGLYDACRLDTPDGPIQLSVDRDIWQSQVRAVSPMGSVLVEIPLAVTRTAPWDHVWARLDAASTNLAQGGETGCKNCVNEVRQALNAWRKIDGFNAGSSRGGLQKDKPERLHDAANALYHYCSLSAHGDEHQVTWTAPTPF